MGAGAVLDSCNQVAATIADFNIILVVRERRKAKRAFSPGGGVGAQGGILEYGWNRLVFEKAAEYPKGRIRIPLAVEFCLSGINAVGCRQETDGVGVRIDGDGRGSALEFGHVGRTIGFVIVFALLF